MSEAVALLFPGQGAQYVGMGREAYARSDAARRIFDRADEVCGYALSRLCFDGPDDALRLTGRQQLAIFACSLALLAANGETLEARRVVAATGHSLGLYTALVVAGALTLDDALALVAVRGALMQQAAEQYPGGMVAVLGLDDHTVESACAEVSDGDEVVVAANYNAPGQVVISGTSQGLARASERLKNLGARKVVPLPVSGAFHSPLMRSAAEQLAPAIRRADIRPAAYPVIANDTASPLQTVDDVRSSLLGQVLAPVRWVSAVRRALSLGTSTLVDCGPGTTVSALARRIAPDVATVTLDRSSS